jgi:hydrogenase maturation factor
MSNLTHKQAYSSHFLPLPLITGQSTSDSIENACTHYEDGHCLTCSDQAIPVKVLCVNHETGLAQVTIGEETEEIDITLVDNVAPGDTLLAHGGVAIERLPG